MLKLIIESDDPSELPLALDAALRLSGSPQYPAVKAAARDHAYLAAGAHASRSGGGWRPLAPGTGADALAAELVLALPGIADRGFALRLQENRDRDPGTAVFLVGPGPWPDERRKD